MAQIALRQHAAAAESFRKAEPYATPHRSFNDYMLRFYLIINALHAGEYAKAYDTYKKYRDCPFPLLHEQFILIEAYFSFLIHMGYLDINPRFRIGKYLNETSNAQTDKQGDNIAIIIAELLYYFSRDKGKFIDRVESINHYSYRHIRSKETLRAKRFLKILCAMPRANFSFSNLSRHARRHIDYISDHTIRMGENIFLEVIPFDVLLPMIFEELGQKKNVG